MAGFLAGLKGYWRAWRLAWSGGLWPLLLIPGMIAALYFPVVAVLTVRYGRHSARYIRDHWLPDFLKHELLLGFLTIGLWALGLYVGFMLFRNVVMILYAPLLAFLSLKTEEKARADSGNKLEQGGVLKGALRGIGMSVASLVLAIACFLFCLGLLVIPIIGEVAMVVLLPLSQMFLAGHGFMDPTWERRGLSVGESFRFAWRQRNRVLGCGGGFLLLAMVPVAGWFLGPTLGVVAGTLIALDTLEDPKTSREVRF